MKTKVIVILLVLLLIGAGLNGSQLWAHHNERSTKDKAVLIGGSAAAGAALGGLLGGKKGALAGAIAGSTGGAIYDRATRNEGHRTNRSTKEKVGLIGGSAAAGAAAGGIAGGKKGALIGAAIGAAGGYVLDKKTRNDGKLF